MGEPRTPDLPENVAPAALAALLAGPRAPVIVDVREQWEVEICAIPGSQFVPMSQLPHRLAELPRQDPMVVLCHHGSRSLQVTRWLRAQGYINAVNLAGGIDRWAHDVEPGMTRY